MIRTIIVALALAVSFDVLADGSPENGSFTWLFGTAADETSEIVLTATLPDSGVEPLYPFGYNFLYTITVRSASPLVADASVERVLETHSFSYNKIEVNDTPYGTILKINDVEFPNFPLTVVGKRVAYRVEVKFSGVMRNRGTGETTPVPAGTGINTTTTTVGPDGQTRAAWGSYSRYDYAGLACGTSC